jgi:predicted Rdx family selenoprotein
VAEELISGLQQPVGRPHPIERLTLIPSGKGVFDVLRDGTVVFSKKQLGRKPEPGEIFKLITR